VKLPNVLDTSLLGRVMQNGRVVRQKLKCGNIKPEKMEQAWKLMKMGLLANRYVTLFADSISTCSFYTETLGVDGHDPSKVINLDDIRKQFVENIKSGNLTIETHPIMRNFNHPACDKNPNMEIAKVAAVCCLHQCITNCCGGDPKTGNGCRFSFPRKKLKYTVPAIMQINAEEMEAQIFLRRTCDRVCSTNRHYLKFFRSNVDFIVLIDSAHKMRYATKYASKSGKCEEMLTNVIDELNSRSTDVIPPTIKRVLTNVILADSSHRSFMTKQELSYKVLGLPDVRRSFPSVNVVGFYPRANLVEQSDDGDVIVYSDRTDYSAYAERCNASTVIRYPKGTDDVKKANLKKELRNMCFREFVDYYSNMESRQKYSCSQH